MKTSNHWTILLCLFPITGLFGIFGQTITTYDTRKGIEPIVSNYAAVDLAITDVQANPSYAPYLRGLAAPAMFDSKIMQGVMITGTVEQAEADLNKLRAWNIPVTPRQFKLALLDIDVYPETVEEAIATIEDAKLRTAAQIEWREASVFRRDHPLLAQIAPLLGATDEMLDAIFLNAQGKE
jgi:hypothetical protein